MNSIKSIESDGNLKVESQTSMSTNEFILNEAIKQRNNLVEEFKKIKSNVNPLILIQLPDKNVDDDIKNEVIKILDDNFNVNTDNGKLAIYLSENKENLDTISKNDDQVEVMIFKQAIALGGIAQEHQFWCYFVITKV